MTLQTRLEHAMDTAGFTTTDMAVWFACDRSSMRKWAVEGVMPRDVTKKLLEPSLKLLEKLLKSKKLKGRFPVPLSVTQYGRKEYIQGVKQYAAKEFSKTRSAK